MEIPDIYSYDQFYMNVWIFFSKTRVKPEYIIFRKFLKNCGDIWKKRFSQKLITNLFPCKKTRFRCNFTYFKRFIFDYTKKIIPYVLNDSKHVILNNENQHSTCLACISWRSFVNRLSDFKKLVQCYCVHAVWPINAGLHQNKSKLRISIWIQIEIISSHHFSN